jgi:hypothetical protein
MLSVVYAECSTFYVTLSAVFFNVVLGVVMTSVSMSNAIYTERHFFNVCGIFKSYAECRYADCRYADCRYASVVLRIAAHNLNDPTTFRI